MGFLVISNELLLAAEFGEIDKVKALLGKDGININQTNKSGCTPLFLAAARGHKEVVEALLGATGINVNHVDRYGFTPLLIAAHNGHNEVVEALLGKVGININQANSRGETPLLIAAHKGRKEVVEALLGKDGININHADHKGQTPLIFAAHNGHNEVVEALLGKDGIDINHASNGHEITPLLIAAHNGHNEVVEALLGKDGIDINQANKSGYTPLLIAADRGHNEVVEVLLEGGADYRSALSLAENKRLLNIHLNLRKSWHKLISEKLTDNPGYKSQYAMLEELISKCPVTMEVLYDPVSLFPSGHTVERSSWEGIRANNGLCPITRSKVTEVAANHDLRNINEKIWGKVEDLYMKMISDTSLHDASVFASRKRPRPVESLEPAKKTK
jgi:ankyrin repeat protein